MSYHKPHSQAGQVAHNWAHKFDAQYKKDHTAGSLYYINETGTIYSYGTHFPIAKHVTNKKGESAVVFTTKGYSNTTAKHIHTVKSAVTHLNVIYCKEVASGYYKQDSEHGKNLEYWEKEIKEIALNLPNARKPGKYVDQIEHVIKQMQGYVAFFGIKLTKEQKKFFSMPVVGYTKLATATLEERAKQQAKREAEQKARIEEELKLFRNFELNEIWNSGNVAYLRYNKESKRIETSKRIEIPVEVARRFYKWVKAQILSGGCNGNCEMKILNYSVKAVNDKEFTVGCHTITIAEADQLAKQLKWKI